MIQSPAFWLVLVGSAAAYWLLPRKLALPFLVATSFAYLTSVEPVVVPTLVGWSLLFFYAAPHAIARARASASGAVLPVLIASILGYLAYYKYLPALLAAFASDALGDSPAIPLGISYFTFKLIHYAVEVAWGNITDRSFWRFAAYIFLFPMFTAGPIERFDHFLAEREESWRFESALEGVFRIAHGIIKTFVFSGLVAPSSYDWVPSSESLVGGLPDTSYLQLGAYLFLSFLYAYVDFSAYSDIAIGASRLFGFRIMENFNFPILATSIGDFWRRWHMTLAGWCQAYVYVPMIGRTRNLYAAIFPTFLVMGVWHGPSLNWVLWGLYHATGVAFYQTWLRFRRRRGWRLGEDGLWRYAGILPTIVFVSGSYAFSTTVDMGPWLGVRILAKMFLIDLPE